MIGGEARRKCTSRAPASRIMRTIFFDVVPRTSESSIRMMRLPSIAARLAECFIRTPSSRALGAEGLADLIHRPAADDGIRPREVDVFEDAGPRRFGWKRLMAVRAAL